jgi:hypothetical protein
VHFESLPFIERKSDPIFDVVDRILRQQKVAREEARAAAEFKVKENQNNVHPLHPLGAGIKQLPDSDSHGIPPQHEFSQTIDQLGEIPNSSTSNDKTHQTFRRIMGLPGSTQLEKLTQLPDSDSHGIPPQHELFQTIDQLVEILNSSTSNDKTIQKLRQIMSLPGSTQLEKLTALGRGSAASPPQIPSSSLKISENLIEHKPHTPPIDDISSSAKSSSSNPGVTPLSRICAFMIL